MLRRACVLATSIAASVAASVAVSCGAPPRPASDLASPAPTAAPPASTAPAVDPPEPALRLPRNFLPTGYRARLAIDPAKDDFRGSIEIAGEIRERSQRLWLHGRRLSIASAVATQRGRTVRVEVTPVAEELLSLRPAEPLEVGAVTLAIEYTGVLERDDDNGVYRAEFDGVSYVETQFEALSARRAFPCFDEPDNKVPWQLTLDVPAKLVALSNTHPVSEAAISDSTKRIVFAPTRPLPSYLVAFAVGPFELVDAGVSRTGIPTRIVALSGRAGETQYAAETANRILALLEDYFGMPHPYEKVDHISRPDAGGGAMENAGLITYGKASLLFDPKTLSFRDRTRWVSTAAHELAHQWFGNLVTMAWWDDIWLNEAFASWIGEKTLAAFEPSWRGDLRAAEDRDGALAADSAITARRVRQPIQNPGDILQSFDSITYEKGAQLLAMFERVIGPDKFRDGVRAYLSAHKDSNARSADFFAALSAAAGRDIEPAFRTFVDQPGAPVVRAELACDAGKTPMLKLEQSRFVLPGSPAPGKGVPWHLPICVAYERGGKRAEACTELTAPSGDLALDAEACPAWWFGNAGGHGYYRVAQAERAVIALRDRGWKQLTQAERMVAFSDVAAFTQTGEIDLALQMSFVPKLLAERHRTAVDAAVDTVDQLLRKLEPRQRAPFDRWIRATFGAPARALSWTPRKGETIDAEAARRVQLPLVAWAGDPALRAQAVALAKRWRELPPELRAEVLAVAADADPAVFDRVLADAPVERDTQLRRDLIGALALVGDPARLRAALALTFDPRLTAREVRALVFGGRPTTLGAVAAYYREHLAELLARYPDDGTASTATLASAFTRSCSAADRDATVAFITEQFANRVGGARSVARATERLDQCIAAKAMLSPKIDAWLKTLR